MFYRLYLISNYQYLSRVPRAQRADSFDRLIYLFYIDFGKSINLQFIGFKLRIDLMKLAEKLSHQKYQPLVISGCSGVGKGTITKTLLDTFPQLFELSVSYTTRKPREGQKQGIHYFFISKLEFEKKIKQGTFMQYCEVHGNFYGTSEIYVREVIDKCKVCVLDIDIQGAQKIYKKHSNWNYVFINAPSIEQLEWRIRHRGTENQDQIKRRLNTAKSELKILEDCKFYKIILNDNMKNCFDEVTHHLNKIYHVLIEVASKK